MEFQWRGSYLGPIKTPLLEGPFSNPFWGKPFGEKPPREPQGPTFPKKGANIFLTPKKPPQKGPYGKISGAIGGGAPREKKIPKLGVKKGAG